MTDTPHHSPTAPPTKKDGSIDLFPGDLPTPMGLLRGAFGSKLFALAALLTAGGVCYHALAKGGTPETASWSLWAMRIGVSFLVAFLFAYLIKRAIKTALLVGAVLIGGAILLHKLGIGVSDEHLASLKDATARSAEYIQHQADTAWATIKTYLPSGGAAGAGLWKGARHNRSTPT